MAIANIKKIAKKTNESVSININIPRKRINVSYETFILLS